MIKMFDLSLEAQILAAWFVHSETNGRHARGVIFIRNFHVLDRILSKVVELQLGRLSKHDLRLTQPNGSCLDIIKLDSRFDLQLIRGRQFTFMSFYGDNWPDDYIAEVTPRLRASEPTITLQTYPIKFLAQMTAN